MDTYIFLDPDDTQEFGLYAIVSAVTGITYAHQRGGYTNEIRSIEGFLVPLGGPHAAAPFVQFFRQFKGNPPRMDSPYGTVWHDSDLHTLTRLVHALPLWKTTNDPSKDDEQVFLELDRQRLDELTEGWIPVRTVYGPGMLIHQNSD